MGPYDSCRLLHLNLTSFIEHPFTNKARLNKALLEECVYKSSLLADDLIELELEAIDRILNKVKGDDSEYALWEKIKINTINGRRAGLGFMGLGDMLAMLGFKYDSPEALEFTKTLMSFMTEVQLKAQTDMAIMRGSFPAWDARAEFSNASGNNSWYKKLTEEYHSRTSTMKIVGRRNISWTSLAPTGTTSMMAGVSSGIEPVFLPFYTRNRKCMTEEDRVDFVDKVGEKYTQFVVVHPMLKQWAIITQNYTEEEVDEWSLGVWKTIWKESPYYGSTSPEINWRKRVEMQGIIQQYTTHSISSTVNLAKDTTEEEISTIYKEAWYHKLKGITIYRDGCRDGIINSIKDNKPTEIQEGRQAPKRPKILDSDCYYTKARGEGFVIVIGLLNNKPYEVFVFKAPDSLTPFSPIRGRTIKVGKMHYRFESEEIMVNKLGIENSSEENLATLYSSMLLRHGVDIKYIIKTAKKGNDVISSFSSAMCRILAKYIDNSEVKGEVCPDCGGKLMREGGCIHCLDCCWSRCS